MLCNIVLRGESNGIMAIAVYSKPSLHIHACTHAFLFALAKAYPVLRAGSSDSFPIQLHLNCFHNLTWHENTSSFGNETKS